MWLFTLSLLYAADTNAGDLWASRTENGAVRLREASDALATTANAVAGAGRMEELAVLHTNADDVVRVAGQLAVWADQAPSIVKQAPPTPAIAPTGPPPRAATPAKHAPKPPAHARGHGG